MFAVTARLAAGLHAAGAGPDINTSGVVTWLVARILPIILAVIGILIIAGARKGQFAKTANTAVIVVFGLFFVFGATALAAFGKQLVDLFLPGSAS